MPNKIIFSLLFCVITSLPAHAAPLFFSCSLYFTNGNATSALPVPAGTQPLPGTEFQQRVIGDETAASFQFKNLLNEAIELKATLEKDFSKFDLIVETQNLERFQFTNFKKFNVDVTGTPFYVAFDGEGSALNSFERADFMLACSVK